MMLCTARVCDHTHSCGGLQEVEVSNSVNMLSNAVDVLDRNDALDPITFLGLRARLAVLITAGTLVVSASSVGLRNVLTSVVAAANKELHT